MTLNLSTVLISLGLISSACAHTYLSSVTVGGVDQGERACLRGLYSGGASNIFPSSPIQDVTVFPAGLTGANMTCGFLPYAAQGTANRKCPVNAGDTMGMTWHHNNNAASDDIIDASHVGPCMVYMARSDTGSGAVWFKVFEEGYNAANQLWCSIRVKNNKGYMEFTIPSTLPSGNYLVRGEIIALHDGNKPNGAQPYVSCAEVTLTGPANGVMPASSYMVSIPGAYSANDPGILFNIYNSYNSYTIPGPALYTAQALPTGNPTTTTTTTTTQQTTQQTTTTTQQTTQQTSAPTSATTQTSAAPTSNSCGDIVSQCLTLCGSRGTTSCQCVNGSPSIVCAGETSAASCLRPFWFF